MSDFESEYSGQQSEGDQVSSLLAALARTEEPAVTAGTASSGALPTSATTARSSLSPQAPAPSTQAFAPTSVPPLGPGLSASSTTSAGVDITALVNALKEDATARQLLLSALGVEQKEAAGVSGRLAVRPPRHFEFSQIPTEFVQALVSLPKQSDLASIIAATSVGMQVSRSGPLAKQERAKWNQGRSGLAVLLSLVSPSSTLTSGVSTHRKSVVKLHKADGSLSYSSALQELQKVLFKTKDWAKLTLASKTVLNARAGSNATKLERLVLLSQAIADTPRWKSFSGDASTVFEGFAQRVLPLLRVLESIPDLWSEDGQSQSVRLGIARGEASASPLISAVRAIVGEIAVVASEWAEYQTGVLRSTLAQARSLILQDDNPDHLRTFVEDCPTFEELTEVFDGENGVAGVPGARELFQTWASDLAARRTTLESARAHAAQGSRTAPVPESPTSSPTTGQSNGDGNFRSQNEVARSNQKAGGSLGPARN